MSHCVLYFIYSAVTNSVLKKNKKTGVQQNPSRVFINERACTGKDADGEVGGAKSKQVAGVFRFGGL